MVKLLAAFSSDFAKPQKPIQRINTYLSYYIGNHPENSYTQPQRLAF
jgi:hypothetical protein